MNSEKICHWINTIEKIKERSCIYCDKDTKKNQISFPEASKCIFTTAMSVLFKANVSLYSNASQYSGAIKACKKFSSREHRQKICHA